MSQRDEVKMAVAATLPSESGFDRSVSNVLSAMEVDPETGLAEGDASERLVRFGPNELEASEAEPAWRKVLAQFQDPLVLLLLVAIAISLLAWALEGADGTPFEAIVIAVIVVLNAGLGLWQESRAEAAVAALQRMAAPHAHVLRDGQRHEVPSSEVVPGDLLLLSEGDAVCADARLIESTSLRVAEAPLTGESQPVSKTIAQLGSATALGDRTNMVFSGTAITSGTGVGVVTRTGMDSELGRIATLLDRTEDAKTPLQTEIDLVGKVLGIAVIVIAVVVSATIILTSEISSGSDLVEVLLVGVSLAVAAVPEGLPAVLAVVLALGVQRMADKNAIVKKLSSVETLGSASVICSDKTGTLTRNEMTVRSVISASGSIDISGSGYLPDGEATLDGERLTDAVLLEEVRMVLGGGSLANNAHSGERDGEWFVEGDPTEAAILVAEAKLGAAGARAARFERLDAVPFTSERKLMSSIEQDNEDHARHYVVTKGAPDVLLGRCTHERSAGVVVALSNDRRAQIGAGVDLMASNALRTLAVAYRPLDDPTTAVDETLEDGLIYLGSVGIIDPPRDEARNAVSEAHAAGIRTVMITGDHPLTAGTIAKQLGVAPPEQSVVTGTDIESFTEPEFREAVRTHSVFARVAPEHKLRIVAALKADGNVVAMTGDGVNDAPALKAADIGVAMGITGTEVSKEAANMILADDNFATILTAVREGRGIFTSIRKFLRYLLSSNMGEVFTMFFGVIGAGLLGIDTAGGTIAVPLLATHILWINLLTDAAPALALGVDPPMEDVMAQPPRRLTDRIIDREMQLGVVLTGAVMATATLAALDLTMTGGIFEASGGVVEGRTAAFTTLVIAQLFNAFSSRSGRNSAFRHLFTNKLLWGAVALSLLLQVAVVTTPFLNTAFDTTPLSVPQWLLCTALASSVLIVDEVKKLILRTNTSVLASPEPVR